jgi:hypothetical protein
VNGLIDLGVLFARTKHLQFLEVRFLEHTILL